MQFSSNELRLRKGHNSRYRQGQDKWNSKFSHIDESTKLYFRITESYITGYDDTAKKKRGTQRLELRV